MKALGKGFRLILIAVLLAGAHVVFASHYQPTSDHSGADANPAAGQNACVQCHIELDSEMDPEEQLFSGFGDGVHARLGLSCADCHGGDPEAFDDEDAAMWDNESFIGIPDKADTPELCGRCHSDPVFMRRYNPGAKTDQVAQYFTSQHGTLLQKGEERVAACTDCHGVHGIYPVSSPLSAVYPLQVPATCGKCHSDAEYMEGFDIPTDQLAEYSTSVHGTALLERQDTGSPACNDCHGNHGAVPPDVDVVDNICGNCHVFNQELFEASPLFGVETHPLCTVCHERHAIAKPTDEFLDWRGDSMCKKCHEDGHEAQRIANTFFNIIDSLKVNIVLADSLIERAEMRGMEVSDLYTAMEDAHRALVQSRTAVHAFSEEFLRETAGEGQKVTAASVTGALELLEQFGFRKQVLLIATLITFFLVIVIWLKVRQIEAKKKS